jgi:hypothetical protein
MKRRHAWALVVVAAVLGLGLIGFLVARQPPRQRQAAADAEALIADLAAHSAEVERAAAEVPKVPGTATETDLHYQILEIDDRMREITARATDLRDRAADVSARASAEWQDRISDALARYVFRLHWAGEQFQERRQERQARIDELVARRAKK